MPGIEIGGGNYNVGLAYLAEMARQRQMALQEAQVAQEANYRNQQLSIAQQEAQSRQQQAQQDNRFRYAQLGNQQSQFDQDLAMKQQARLDALQQQDWQHGQATQEFGLRQGDMDLRRAGLNNTIAQDTWNQGFHERELGQRNDQFNTEQTLRGRQLDSLDKDRAERSQDRDLDRTAKMQEKMMGAVYQQHAAEIQDLRRQQTEAMNAGDADTAAQIERDINHKQMDVANVVRQIYLAQTPDAVQQAAMPKAEREQALQEKTPNPMNAYTNIPVGADVPPSESRAAAIQNYAPEALTNGDTGYRSKIAMAKKKQQDMKVMNEVTDDAKRKPFSEFKEQVDALDIPEDKKKRLVEAHPTAQAVKQASEEIDQQADPVSKLELAQYRLAVLDRGRPDPNNPIYAQKIEQFRKSLPLDPLTGQPKGTPEQLFDRETASLRAEMKSSNIDANEMRTVLKQKLKEAEAEVKKAGGPAVRQNFDATDDATRRKAADAAWSYASTLRNQGSGKLDEKAAARQWLITQGWTPDQADAVMSERLSRMPRWGQINKGPTGGWF
jgi:hypothetical protein